MHKTCRLLIPVLLLMISNAHAQKNGWITLFDGGSTDKFRGYEMKGFPDSAWKVVDSALEAQTGVPNIDLVTKEKFKNFELDLDWKVSVGGNSGVFFHVVESAVHQSHNGNSPNWLDNFEMQILDDIGFNDTAAIRSAGSLYDLIAPQHKQLKPVGEYNQARLIVMGNHVEHWLNGVKVVAYDMGSDTLNTLLANSKFKKNPGYGKSSDGLIMIQHHGQKVWIRNIKVKRL